MQLSRIWWRIKPAAIIAKQENNTVRGRTPAETKTKMRFIVYLTSEIGWDMSNLDGRHIFVDMVGVLFREFPTNTTVYAYTANVRIAMIILFYPRAHITRPWRIENKTAEAQEQSECISIFCAVKACAKHRRRKICRTCDIMKTDNQIIL